MQSLVLGVPIKKNMKLKVWNVINSECKIYPLGQRHVEGYVHRMITMLDCDRPIAVQGLSDLRHPPQAVPVYLLM